MDSIELTKAFGAFFAIMNPFVMLPIFLSLTAGYSVAQQRSLALKVTFYSLIMGLVILFAGQKILGFFSIGIDEFRIAGGLVVAHIAWTMLSGQESASHGGSSEEKAEMSDLSGLAFYPMAFPMIVGPGTIATLIIYSSHAQSTADLLVVGGLAGAVLLIMAFVLYFASSFGKRMSQTMRVIMTRLMGMVLLAIGVEMVIDGWLAVMPAAS